MNSRAQQRRFVSNTAAAGMMNRRSPPPPPPPQHTHSRADGRHGPSPDVRAGAASPPLRSREQSDGTAAAIHGLLNLTPSAGRGTGLSGGGGAVGAAAASALPPPPLAGAEDLGGTPTAASVSAATAAAVVAERAAAAAARHPFGALAAQREREERRRRIEGKQEAREGDLRRRRMELEQGLMEERRERQEEELARQQQQVLLRRREIVESAAQAVQARRMREGRRMEERAAAAVARATATVVPAAARREDEVAVAQLRRAEEELRARRQLVARLRRQQLEMIEMEGAAASMRRSGAAEEAAVLAQRQRQQLRLQALQQEELSPQQPRPPLQSPPQQPRPLLQSPPQQPLRPMLVPARPSAEQEEAMSRLRREEEELRVMTAALRRRRDEQMARVSALTGRPIASGGNSAGDRAATAPAAAAEVEAQVRLMGMVAVPAGVNRDVTAAVDGGRMVGPQLPRAMANTAASRARLGTRSSGRDQEVEEAVLAASRLRTEAAAGEGVWPRAMGAAASYTETERVRARLLRGSAAAENSAAALISPTYGSVAPRAARTAMTHRQPLPEAHTSNTTAPTLRMEEKTKERVIVYPESPSVRKRPRAHCHAEGDDLAKVKAKAPTGAVPYPVDDRDAVRRKLRKLEALHSAQREKMLQTSPASGKEVKDLPPVIIPPSLAPTTITRVTMDPQDADQQQRAAQQEPSLNTAGEASYLNFSSRYQPIAPKGGIETLLPTKEDGGEESDNTPKLSNAKGCCEETKAKLSASARKSSFPMPRLSSNPKRAACSGDFGDKDECLTETEADAKPSYCPLHPGPLSSFRERWDFLRQSLDEQQRPLTAVRYLRSGDGSGDDGDGLWSCPSVRKLPPPMTKEEIDAKLREAFAVSLEGGCRPGLFSSSWGPFARTIQDTSVTGRYGIRSVAMLLDRLPPRGNKSLDKVSTFFPSVAKETIDGEVKADDVAGTIPVPLRTAATTEGPMISPGATSPATEDPRSVTGLLGASSMARPSNPSAVISGEHKTAESTPPLSFVDAADTSREGGGGKVQRGGGHLLRSPGGKWFDAVTGQAVDLAVLGDGRRGLEPSTTSSSTLAPQASSAPPAIQNVMGAEKTIATLLPPLERRQSLPRSA